MHELRIKNEYKMAMKQESIAKIDFKSLSSEVNQLKSKLLSSKNELQLLLKTYTKQQVTLQRITRSYDSVKLALRQSEEKRDRTEVRESTEIEKKNKIQRQLIQLEQSNEKALENLNEYLEKNKSLKLELDKIKSIKWTLEDKISVKEEEINSLTKSVSSLCNSLNILKVFSQVRETLFTAVENQRSEALRLLEIYLYKMFLIKPSIEVTSFFRDKINRKVIQTSWLELKKDTLNYQNEREEIVELMNEQLKKEFLSMSYLIQSLSAGFKRKESELKATSARVKKPSIELQNILIEQLKTELHSASQHLDHTLCELDKTQNKNSELLKILEDKETVIKELFIKRNKLEYFVHNKSQYENHRNHELKVEDKYITRFSEPNRLMRQRKNSQFLIRKTFSSFLLQSWILEKRLKPLSHQNNIGIALDKIKDFFKLNGNILKDNYMKEKNGNNIIENVSVEIDKLLSYCKNLRSKIMINEINFEEYEADLRSSKEHINFLIKLLIIGDRTHLARQKDEAIEISNFSNIKPLNIKKESKYKLNKFKGQQLIDCARVTHN
jgi:hypothetical protein